MEHANTTVNVSSQSYFHASRYYIIVATRLFWRSLNRRTLFATTSLYCFVAVELLSKSSSREVLRSLGLVVIPQNTKKVVKGYRLLVGWTSAHVKLLDAKPMMCFKYLELGRARARCTSVVDGSDQCFWCGGTGHKASGCQATSCCKVCAAAGRPATWFAATWRQGLRY